MRRRTMSICCNFMPLNMRAVSVCMLFSSRSCFSFRPFALPAMWTLSAQATIPQHPFAPDLSRRPQQASAQS